MRISFSLNAIIFGLTICFSSHMFAFSQPDSSGIRDLLDQSKVLQSANKYDSSYVMLTQAFQGAKSIVISDNLYLGILRNLGSVEARRGQIDSSLYWLDKGLAYIDEKPKLAVQRVDFLINKGVSYYFAKDLDKAIPLYIEANKLCREYNLVEKRTKVLNNLGIFYRTLNRYYQAIELYEEAYIFRQNLKDTAGMANLLLNKSVAYSFLDNEEEAFAAVKKARTLYEKIGNTNDVCLAKITEGTILKKLGRRMEAFELLKIFISENTCNLEPIHEIFLNLTLGRLYADFNQQIKAKEYLAKVERYEIPRQMYAERMELLSLKSILYESDAEHIKALAELRQYVKLSEEHSLEKNRRIVKEMETRFLTNEKDAEIKLLEADRRIVDLELIATKQRNLTLTIAISFLALFTGLLIYMIKKIRDKNRIISKAHDDKEILLREIHHRVKNNLQVVSALLKLQSRFVEDENAIEALRLGQDRVESMALIHKDLYQHDNLKGVNTKDYFHKLVQSLLQSYQIDEPAIKLNLNVESIWLDVDTMVPLGLMVNELLSNAIEHAFVDQSTGELSVFLKESEQGLILEIKDNGKGVESFDSMKTKSFGYSLVQSFAKKLEAEIDYKNENGLQINLLIKSYSKVV